MSVKRSRAGSVGDDSTAKDLPPKPTPLTDK